MMTTPSQPDYSLHHAQAAEGNNVWQILNEKKEAIYSFSELEGYTKDDAIRCLQDLVTGGNGVLVSSKIVDEAPEIKSFLLWSIETRTDYYIECESCNGFYDVPSDGSGTAEELFKDGWTIRKNPMGLRIAICPRCSVTCGGVHVN